MRFIGSLVRERERESELALSFSMERSRQGEADNKIIVRRHKTQNIDPALRNSRDFFFQWIEASKERLTVR